MTDEAIVKIIENAGLGHVSGQVSQVSGGFMHRMYRVDTPGGTYAVKHLNPVIMKRPDAMDNYRRAEKLEVILEEAGIPIAPALTVNGKKMQELDGEYYYIFNWLDGHITDWDGITADQCRQAGTIQGRIHTVKQEDVLHIEQEPVVIDWDGYIKQAERISSPILPLLKADCEILTYAQDAVNTAKAALPDIVCITDEDMDPKNVMWVDGRPVVIDLECLDYGNPVSHVLQLSLQWAGITTCDLNLELQKSFFEGYLEAYDNGFRDYGSVFGVAYTWIEWLEYNITRALDSSLTADEQKLGITEVTNTLRRLEYLRDREESIISNLERILA